MSPHDYDAYPFPWLSQEEYSEIRRDPDLARRIDAAKARAEEATEKWANENGVKAMLRGATVAFVRPGSREVEHIEYVRLTS